MKTRKTLFWDKLRKLLKNSAVTFVFLIFSVALSGAAWNPYLPSSMLIGALAKGDAVTDPRAILRNALPIDNDNIREVQSAIEDLSKQLRGKRWPQVKRDIKDASYLLTTKGEQILASVPDQSKSQGKNLLESLKAGLGQLDEAADNQDREAIWTERRKLLGQITELEDLMVKGFPFAVPPEYANLPQLKGRATVEMATTQGPLTIVVDGFSAPVNGGNFVDLVQRGFYDGLSFIRSEDNFVLQTGDPEGSDNGFIDPNTGEYRAIPLEVLIKGQEKPIYGNTLEDEGIYLAELALPFNAYGAVALARPENDPNGGSSQFFFFKFDNELTPPGFNMMDGRYAIFGYLVEGKETLENLTDKDKIISAKVVEGAENLVQPQKT